MEENTQLMTIDNICNRVYIIRGHQVMNKIILFGSNGRKINY